MPQLSQPPLFRRSRRRFATILAISLGTLFTAGAGWPLVAQPPAAAPNPADVAGEPTRSPRLVVDFGDGVEKHFTQLSWREGMTVLQLLQAAAKHPRGIRFEHRGQGATAFVTEIDGVKNEGRGANWVYRVNGKLATQSCGVQPVQAADTVLWKFGKYR